jgi:hypothetical protein
MPGGASEIRGGHWSEEEKEFIRLRYSDPSWTATRIGEVLKRSKESVRVQAGRMGLTSGQNGRPVTLFWTEERDNFVRLNYHTPQWSVSRIAQYFGCTNAKVSARAQTLGVSKPRKRSHEALEKKAKRAATTPVAIAPRLARLAEFDPVFKRVLQEKQYGFAPGSLINVNDVNASRLRRDV